MVKRGRKDYRSRNKKKSKPRIDRSNDESRVNFSDFVFTNESFMRYYMTQEILDVSEWDIFMKALATPLPTSFRINSSCAYAGRIRERIATDFKFEDLVVDDEIVPPISNLPWYPNEMGFQWSVERRKVRKLPLLAAFQKWLVELSDSGDITRQEAVSMIPPLLLEVAPHHKVLDMCAAPGSKTSQLLESLHAEESLTGKIPTGMVVANDVDLKRAYMLVHQSKRIGSPALLVTCTEAQKFPALGASDTGGAATEEKGFFDRILCDAPCSGDGTLRKNPIIWKSWNARNGISLHPLQVEIAQRGASLLVVGGYMCYSTCTFNPIENEAVVAELLRWGGGSLELVDVNDKLSLLKRRPGLQKWTVMDSDLQIHKSMQEIPEDSRLKLKQSMFPPASEEVEKFHLERCMRCVPHDQNTGGFFICLIKKVAETPANCDITASPASVTIVGDNLVVDKAKQVGYFKEDDALADDEAESAEEIDIKGKKKAERRRARLPLAGEEYVKFTDEQYEELNTIYKFKGDFPQQSLITRSGDAKTVTFVTSSITMDLLHEMKRKNLKVVYTGIKAFERTETSGLGKKTYRLCQTGVSRLSPYLTQRKMEVSIAEMQLMVENCGELLGFEEFEAPTAAKLQDFSIGSIACALNAPSQSIAQKMAMNVVIWRGRNSVNIMAAKVDAAAILSAMKELGMYNQDIHDLSIARKAKRRLQKDQQAGDILHQAVDERK